jgi:hypothetical protein
MIIKKDPSFGESEEQWLREEVAATYDAHKANPDLASPLDEVARRLDAFMNNVGRRRTALSKIVQDHR